MAIRLSGTMNDKAFLVIRAAIEYIEMRKRRSKDRGRFYDHSSEEGKTLKDAVERYLDD